MSENCLRTQALLRGGEVGVELGNLKHFGTELRLFNSETLDSPEKDSSHSKEKCVETAER